MRSTETHRQTMPLRMTGQVAVPTVDTSILLHALHGNASGDMPLRMTGHNPNPNMPLRMTGHTLADTWIYDIYHHNEIIHCSFNTLLVSERMFTKIIYEFLQVIIIQLDFARTDI